MNMCSKITARIDRPRRTSTASKRDVRDICRDVCIRFRTMISAVPCFHATTSDDIHLAHYPHLQKTCSHDIVLLWLTSAFQEGYGFHGLERVYHLWADYDPRAAGCSGPEGTSQL